MATATTRAFAPLEALTDVTAARIGPAHGAHTKPSAPPTVSPDQKPVPRVLGPKRASRDSGASSRAVTLGISSANPNTISTTIASVLAAPLARPTPLTNWARRTIAIVNVAASPSTIPIGRRRPPVALDASKAGTTGSTQGVIAVPAPAIRANSNSTTICETDDAAPVLRKG